MTQLDDDLAAYLAAATSVERQAALSQWLTDATNVLDTLMTRVDNIVARMVDLTTVMRRTDEMDRRITSPITPLNQ